MLAYKRFDLVKPPLPNIEVEATVDHQEHKRRRVELRKAARAVKKTEPPTKAAAKKAAKPAAEPGQFETPSPKPKAKGKRRANFSSPPATPTPLPKAQAAKRTPTPKAAEETLEEKAPADMAICLALARKVAPALDFDNADPCIVSPIKETVQREQLLFQIFQGKKQLVQVTGHKFRGRQYALTAITALHLCLCAGMTPSDAALAKQQIFQLFKAAQWQL